MLDDIGASDATYHVMWIILFNALDDFGIREVNDYVRAGSPPDTAPNAQFENLKRKIAEEGLHGALRIAGLVGHSLTMSVKLVLMNFFRPASCRPTTIWFVYSWLDQNKTTYQ